jgi:hypothetical protein
VTGAASGDVVERVLRTVLTLGLAVLLAGCSFGGGDDSPAAAPGRVRVPRLIGLDRYEAEAMLADRGLTVVWDDCPEFADTVRGQAPPSATRLRLGSQVFLSPASAGVVVIPAIRRCFFPGRG